MISIKRQGSFSTNSEELHYFRSGDVCDKQNTPHIRFVEFKSHHQAFQILQNRHIVVCGLQSFPEQALSL